MISRLFIIALVILSFLVSACSVQPAKRRQVDQLVALHRDSSIDCPDFPNSTCAIKSPLIDLARSLSRDSSKMHHISSLEVGEAALLARLHLIDAAEHQIDIQSFIWMDDAVGRLVLKKALTAARRGVKVRLLIDQPFAVNDVQFITRLALMHSNLEIKFYNPTFDQGETNAIEFIVGLACCFKALNHRMHNKLFLIDSSIGIVGGRNYQNRYYDFDPEFNYKDRDVLVVGQVAESMQVSFDAFWNHSLSVNAKYLSDVSFKLLANADELNTELFSVSHDDMFSPMLAFSQDYHYISSQFLKSSFKVDRLEYHSDLPGKPRRQAEDFSHQIQTLIGQADHQVLVQTPYLLLSREAVSTFKELREEHPDIDIIVSTNSLASTDAFYVYAISLKQKKKFVKKLGLRIFEMKPRPEDVERIAPRVRLLKGDYRAKALVETPKNGLLPTTGKGPRFGLHAKSFVIDNHITLIGSHNFDPRSEDLNTESGLIIWDEKFAESIKQQIIMDIQPRNSWTIAKHKGIPLISSASSVVGSISRALPILDVWPFRYQTSFELNEGARVVSSKHPDFYKNYSVVGDFPEVGLSFKQIQTFFVSAFLGFARPIL